MRQRDFHQKDSFKPHQKVTSKQSLTHLVSSTLDQNSPLSIRVCLIYSLGHFEWGAAHIMGIIWELAREAVLNTLLSSPASKPS